MTEAELNQRFIDALREVIGLVPLYRYGVARPSYERQALEAMGRAIGDGNRRIVTTVGLEKHGTDQYAFSDHADVRELSPREIARLRASKPLRGSHRLNGQRVGIAFVTLGRRT